MSCKVCIKEFDRVTNDHTTLSHIKDKLSDTIEAYERHCYNHGGLNEFANKLFIEIGELERERDEEAVCSK